MNIFISWSGNRSKLVAELLCEWLQCVIQAAKPWVSTQDIEGGTLWFNEINNQLANTTTGLVCLTKENRNKPWILFESGALAKGLTSSRVYTFLIDLEPSDLENPLAQFNHTMPTKEGMKKLVRNINVSLLENGLKESILNTVFETYWEQFEQKFNQILEATPTNTVEIKRSNDDILNEVLTTVRNLDKRVRNVEKEEIVKSNFISFLNDDKPVKASFDVDKSSYQRWRNKMEKDLQRERDLEYLKMKTKLDKNQLP